MAAIRIPPVSESELMRADTDRVNRLYLALKAAAKILNFNITHFEVIEDRAAKALPVIRVELIQGVKLTEESMQAIERALHEAINPSAARSV